MIDYILRTILVFTVACSAVGVCHAGVITDVDLPGRISSAVLNDGSGELNIKFIFDAYNNIKSNPPTDTMPWYDGDSTQLTERPTTHPPFALAIELLDAIEGLDTPTVLNEAAAYMFVVDAKQSENAVFGYIVAHFDGEWQIAVAYPAGEAIPADQVVSAATHDPPIDLLYASLDTGGNVPEPSTAVAMGLLSILSFAGNRRRRRQESVA